MTTDFPEPFAQQYKTHLKHLKLKGLQPKTIDAYARAIRRLGGYFGYRIDALTEVQLTEYFSDLIGTHSWSAVKLDLYGLKFFTTHVLKNPWAMPNLIKPPKTQRLPDIVTVDEAQRLFWQRGCSAIGSSTSPFTASVCAWARGWPSKSATSMPRAGESRCATPRATGIGWCRCRRPRFRRCAASGRRTATPSCCFPTVTPASRAQPKPPRRSIAAGCRGPCAKSPPSAD